MTSNLKVTDNQYGGRLS